MANSISSELVVRLLMRFIMLCADDNSNNASLYNSHTVTLIIFLANCFNGCYYREVGLAWNWIDLQAVTMVLLRFVMT